MGLAASQARYLALSARKTNTEYEGQQLNQQRLNLANQSADLFNQMLTMSVPTCPDSNDYTKLQYSWSDGINNSVISDYYQLGEANEDYNYAVTSYYNTKVYTGAVKKMNDPQVQANKTNHYTVNEDKSYKVLQSTYVKESAAGAGDDSYTLLVERNGVQSTKVFTRATDKTSTDTVEELDALENRTTKITGGNYAKAVSKGSVEQYWDNVTDPTNPTWADVASGDTADGDEYSVRNMSGSAITVSVKNPNYNPEEEISINNPQTVKVALTTYDGNTASTGADGESFIYRAVDFDSDNADMIEIANQVKQSYGAKFDANETYYYIAASGHGTDSSSTVSEATATSEGFFVDNTGVIHDDTQENATKNGWTAVTVPVYETTAGTYTTDFTQANGYVQGDEINTYAFITGTEMENSDGSQGDASKVTLRSSDDTVYYTDGTNYLTAQELSSIDLTIPAGAAEPRNDTLYFHSATNDPTYSNYTAVGNCDLNQLTVDDYNDNSEISIELEQVLKDMKASNPEAYANLAKCFDTTTGEYTGGIYSFKYAGKTYYTTETDLDSALAGAQEQNLASNGIDGQSKLAYYGASYLDTKVEETKKALLETDGAGRFSSIKWEDDSVTYSLNCETVTDEDAYNNAMNKYYYNQEQYDDEVAKINAKTEIIEAEDRELQLRLEQLGTEQSALQTEMEACQKVVSKNVEMGFKTFSS